MKNYAILLIMGAVVLVAVLLAPEKDAVDRPPETEAEVSFEETEHDFGVVKQSGGVVSHDFPFVYEGKTERRIVGVPTSCGCTSAEVDVDVLKPGQGGVLTVTFDPNLHAEPEGKFFKTAELLTEPPLEGNAEVRIWAEIDLDLGPEAYKQALHDDNHEGGEAYHTMTAAELRGRLAQKDFYLLDVHIPEQGHIPSTDAFIPFNALPENADSLPADKDAKIVVYCRSGSMSRQAAETLTEMGYTDVWDLEGGINAFNAL